MALFQAPRNPIPNRSPHENGDYDYELGVGFESPRLEPSTHHLHGIAAVGTNRWNPEVTRSLALHMLRQ